MKKTRASLLALLLALACLLGAFPVMAEDAPTASFTYEYGGMTVTCATKDAVEGRVTAPDAPEVLTGFVGWYAELGGTARLIPAGGVCTDVTEDVTFTAVCVDFKTNQSASVRLLGGDVALRFTSTVTKASYHALTAIVGEAGVSFGTYIVPLSYVKKAFTLEALAAAGYTQYIDVPASTFYAEDEDSATIAGSVGQILYDHYTLKYTAIGYMKVTYTDGTVGTVYAAYNRDKNNASVAKTVLQAYEDRTQTPDATHTHKVEMPLGTVYSPYTSDERTLCEEFLDKIALIGLGVDDNDKYRYFVYKTEYYVSPWDVDYVLDQYEDATITVKAPVGRSVNEIWGVYIDGARRSLEDVTILDERTLVFVRSPYIGTLPK